MKKLTLVLIFKMFYLFGYGQPICGTVFPEVDPLQGLSFKLEDDDRIYEFNLVYTVLYLQPSDTVKLSRAWLQQETNIMNTYFRLANTDIIQVPEPYRSLATDSRIKINIAGIRYIKSGNPAFPSFSSFMDPAQGGAALHNPQNTLNYYYAPYTWSTGVAILPNGPPASFRQLAVTSLAAALSGVNSHYTAFVNIHELFHNFGLYHTFQGGCSETNCTTQGDRVCDTPPHTTSGCSNLDSGCGNGTTHNGHNHMSYSDRITCAKMQTAGQVERAHSFILTYYQNHIGTTPPNQPPTCVITAPKDTTITPNSYIQITISATDDKQVSYVDLHFDIESLSNDVEFVILNPTMQIIIDSTASGNVLYRFTQPPYTVGLRPYYENVYIWHAHATDNEGLTTTSAPVRLTVKKKPAFSLIKETVLTDDNKLIFKAEDGREKIVE